MEQRWNKYQVRLEAKTIEDKICGWNIWNQATISQESLKTMQLIFGGALHWGGFDGAGRYIGSIGSFFPKRLPWHDKLNLASYVWIQHTMV